METDDLVHNALVSAKTWFEAPMGTNVGPVTPVLRKLREAISYREAELNQKAAMEKKAS